MLPHTGTLLMHVDGGSNVHICTQKSLFYRFTATPSRVQEVTGSKAMCRGIGVVIILFVGTTFTITFYLVYYMSDNPQNTLGTPAIKYYNKFRIVQVETLQYIKLVSNTGEKYIVYTDQDNINSKLLDYICVHIVTPTQSPHLTCNASTSMLFPKNELIDRILIHRRLMHISQHTIDKMCKEGTLHNLPSKLSKHHANMCP